MEDNGVLISSKSTLAAPMILRKKSDGSLRPVIDYRSLNAVTTFDPYPLPRINDLLNKVGGYK